jgi:hypothetical protein
MMLKFKWLVPDAGAIGAAALAVALWSAAALAQNSSDSADSYQAGVDLGRTLTDPRQCPGSGVYHGGCMDGVQEHQFDREADQALDSVTSSDAKPAEHAPMLSPPPGMFQDPFSKPGDTQPPNN